MHLQENIAQPWKSTGVKQETCKVSQIEYILKQLYRFLSVHVYVEHFLETTTGFSPLSVSFNFGYTLLLSEPFFQML